jgi:hypothetical protein
MRLIDAIILDTLISLGIFYATLVVIRGAYSLFTMWTH